MKKKFYIFILLVLTLVVILFAVDRILLPEPNQEVYRNCKLVRIGMTYNEVVQIMGKPASETKNDGKVQSLYLAGGIQTEKGIAFEFQDGHLITKNCGD